MEELDTAYVTFDGADLEAFNAVEKRDKRGSPSWELRTASPRGHYGERLQRDSCLKKHMKKHHPLAGDSP